MTSKELVKRAIEFRNPERVPYNFDSNRETGSNPQYYGEDFQWVFLDTDPNFVPSVNNDKEYESEWGVIYHRIKDRHGEPKLFPLEDIERVFDYTIPDFTAPERYKTLEKAVENNKDKYILGMFPHFLFLHMLDIFGFENLMVQLVEEQEKVEYMADKLTESCVKVVNCMADRGVDGMIAIEDLGVQDRLIISPKMWRSIFKPRMARIIEAAHQRGLHVISHTCGYILDIIEDMIEIGLDVIQIDQQDNMGIDKLAGRYAGRICFFCPVDIQTTLPFDDPEKIEDKAKHLIRAFGSHNGGFMAKTYPQPQSINIPEKNTKFMCDCFKRYGKYPLE